MRLPHLKRCSTTGKPMTQLDCSVGGHTGVFTITRLPDGRWACHDCLVRVIAPTLSADEIAALQKLAAL